MNEQVANRVTNIFDKLNSLSDNVQDEKNNRFQGIYGVIQQFELRLQGLEQSKDEAFNLLGQQLRTFADLVNAEAEQRQRVENETQKLITDLERNTKRLLEANYKDRIEVEKRVSYAINQQVEQLSSDVAKEAQLQQTSHQYLEAFNNEDLPKIADELQNEIQERKEVEEKIYRQFVEQINEIKELCDREKREREVREEEIIEILRSIQIRISDALRRSKFEREKTEEEMIKLVETIIEKIKKEMIQMNI